MLNTVYCSSWLISQKKNDDTDTETTDPDFEEKLQEDNIQEITLIDYTNVDYYKCCSTKGVVFFKHINMHLLP